MDKKNIEVIVHQQLSTRGGSKQVQSLKVDVLADNVQLFLGQMNEILEKTPEALGKFHFEEFEVNAEITGKGTITLFGTGGELGATGGLRFLFRRSSK